MEDGTAKPKTTPEGLMLREQMPLTSASKQLHNHSTLLTVFAGVTEPGHCPAGLL